MTPTLRALTRADAANVLRIYSGASLQFLGRPEMTQEEAVQYIARAQSWAGQEAAEQYALGVDVAGDLVGVVKLRCLSERLGQISYILRADTWGRGHATAAVKQLVRFVFATVGLTTLGARHHPDNLASGRVLVKAGFECQGPHEGFIGYRLTLPRRCRSSRSATKPGPPEHEEG